MVRDGVVKNNGLPVLEVLFVKKLAGIVLRINILPYFNFVVDTSVLKSQDGGGEVPLCCAAAATWLSCHLGFVLGSAVGAVLTVESILRRRGSALCYGLKWYILYPSESMKV